MPDINDLQLSPAEQILIQSQGQNFNDAWGGQQAPQQGGATPQQQPPAASPFDQYLQSVIDQTQNYSRDSIYADKVKEYYRDLGIKNPDSWQGKLAAHLSEIGKSVQANNNRPAGQRNTFNDYVGPTERLHQASDTEFEKQAPLIKSQMQELLRLQKEREQGQTTLTKTAMQEATKWNRNDIQRLRFLAQNGDTEAAMELKQAMTEKVNNYNREFEKDPNFAQKTDIQKNVAGINRFANENGMTFEDARQIWGRVSDAVRPTQEGIKQYGTDQEFNKYVPRDYQLQLNKQAGRPNANNNTLVKIAGPSGQMAFATKQQVLDSLGIKALGGQPSTPTPTGSSDDVTIPQYAAGQPDKTQLAYDNNNPGNLRFANQSGAVSGRGGYAKFDSASQGYEALVDQVRLDQRRGLTLGQYINKFAPPNENNTAAYIQRVSTAVGLSPDQPIAGVSADKIAQAQMKVESGATYGAPQNAAQLVQNFSQSIQPGSAMQPFNPKAYATQQAFEASRINSRAAVANALATIKEGKEDEFMGMGEGNRFMKFLRANTDLVGDAKSTHEVTQNIVTSNANNLHALAIRGGRFSDQQSEAMSRALVGDMANPKSMVRAYAANMLLVEMQQRETAGKLDIRDITPEVFSTMSRNIEKMVNQAYASRGTNLEPHIPDLDEILTEAKRIQAGAPGVTSPSPQPHQASVDEMMRRKK